MAASDPNTRIEPLPAGGSSYLSAAALSARLDEEVHRAERHGTELSCLLLVIENLDELASEHGSELPEETLTYVGGALLRELRDFDRIGRPSEHELLIVLPGADSPRGEIVARRVLERLRAIKVEAEGARRPLRVSMGLASWHKDVSGVELLARTRAAAPRGNGVEPVADGVDGVSPADWAPAQSETDLAEHPPRALGRITPS
jgi:diguanylate cyclase (GGDEF)-like protein